MQMFSYSLTNHNINALSTGTIRSSINLLLVYGAGRKAGRFAKYVQWDLNTSFRSGCLKLQREKL